MPQGAGKRLFADSGPAIKLAFAGSEACSNGALHLTCRPAAQGGRAWPWYAQIGVLPSAARTGTTGAPG
jgi:hypothetical protein